MPLKVTVKVDARDRECAREKESVCGSRFECKCVCVLVCVCVCVLVRVC